MKNRKEQKPYFIRTADSRREKDVNTKIDSANRLADNFLCRNIF